MLPPVTPKPRISRTNTGEYTYNTGVAVRIKQRPHNNSNQSEVGAVFLQIPDVPQQYDLAPEELRLCPGVVLKYSEQ